MPMDGESEAGKADWKEILSRVLPYVDFFVPSIEELCFMLDRERYEEWRTNDGGHGGQIVLEHREDLPLAVEGYGNVHHAAWRVPTSDERLCYWQSDPDFQRE